MRMLTTTVAGGGLLFAQERRTKTKTKEEFDQEMENPGSLLNRAK